MSKIVKIVKYIKKIQKKKIIAGFLINELLEWDNFKRGGRMRLLKKLER